MTSNIFTKKGYLSILTSAKKNNYTICPVKKARQAKFNSKPVLILRHDVDLDIDAALLMAQLEKEENVRSTYFILLYNDFYNPLSPSSKSKIAEIKKLNHEVGIHWDSRDYKHSEKTRFKRDLELLSEIIGEKIISGSQHEPLSAPLSNPNDYLKFEAYRNFKDFTYLSDSSMKFRQNPHKLIEDRLDIQLLIHPFWWMCKGKTRKEKFDNFLSDLTKRHQTIINKYYKSTQNFLKNRDKKDNNFKL